jgi:hypothetical protein
LFRRFVFLPENLNCPPWLHDNHPAMLEELELRIYGEVLRFTQSCRAHLELDETMGLCLAGRLLRRIFQIINV